MHSLFYNPLSVWYKRNLSKFSYVEKASKG